MEVGFVKSVKNFLIYLDGLPNVRINDLVENEEGQRGWVNALLPDSVEVLLLDKANVVPGQMFKRTGEKLTIPGGDPLLGRVINPLGIPLDGKKPLSKSQYIKGYELDQQAYGIDSREFISNQFKTGITLIDSLVPLGQGQRELILGDARSGKTDFLLNIILNQKQTGVICIFASIGKPVTEVKNIINSLKANNALDYTTVIATSSTDTAPLIFLTPQAAFTAAESFQRQGKNVLVILDDLGNHAKIYREIALLGNRAPGRESYPGDIFYQHAHLLERAGNFKKEAGGGSITALPIIELNLNDFTTFIPTNLMSMTDGHLLFKSSLYLQDFRPAVDVSLSVSRVGAQTQNRIHNSLATKVKQILAQAAKLETVSRFSFELPYSTQLILQQKEQIEELLQQPSSSFIPAQIQIILLALPFTKFFQDKNRPFVKQNKEKLIAAFSSQNIATLKSEEELFNLLEKITPNLEILTNSAKPPKPPAPPLAIPKKPQKKSLVDKLEGLLIKKA